MSIESNIDVLIDGMIGFYSYKMCFENGFIVSDRYEFEFYPEILN